MPLELLAVYDGNSSRPGRSVSVFWGFVRSAEL